MSLSNLCRTFLVSGLTLIPPVAFSANREVTTHLDTVEGSLRSVIAAADPGDRVIFAQGVTGPINYTADADILIDKDLTIDASGVTGGITISADNRDRVFSIAFGATVEMINLTITNGRAADGTSGTTTANPGGEGGGIHNSGTLTLRNCVVTGNRAGDGGSAEENVGRPGGSGGGIYSTGMLTLIDCVVSGNVAGKGGRGGIGSDMSRKNAGVGGNGGGICQVGGEPMTILRCTISDNTSGDGGIGAYNGRSGGRGGGIYVTGPSEIEASTISGNLTGDGGVSEEAGGRAGGDGGPGGGIYFTSTLTVVNSTFSGNGTGDGAIGAPFQPGDGGNGGAIVAGGTATFENVTVYGNSTGAVADGVFSDDGIDGGDGGGFWITVEGSVTLRNSVIASNTAGPGGEGPDLFGEGVITPDGANFIGKNSTVEVAFPDGILVGTGSSPLDPLLGPLAANGGGTFTHAPDAESPLVDPSGGSAASVHATDQRGSVRKSGFTVDIGAVEFFYREISLRAPARVKTGKSKANFRVVVSAPVSTVLHARATAKAKASVAGSGGRRLVKVRKLKRGKTKVFLTAIDVFGRTASDSVLIELQERR